MYSLVWAGRDWAEARRMERRREWESMARVVRRTDSK